MYIRRLSLGMLMSVSVFLLNGQIFINTGNPNLQKYKSNDPNAVIWQNGQNVPIPPNTPTEPADLPKKALEVKKTVEAKPTTTPVVKEETKPATEQMIMADVPKGTTPPDYPEWAVPGKCYARCVSQDQFEYKEEQVIDKPASFRIEKIAAKYETVYDTVIVKAAYNKVIPVPAQYDVISEQQLVTPATKRWVKGKGDMNCLSQNPADCEVWCLKEIPPVYKTVTRKIEKSPATSREELVPAVTKVVPRKKLVTPASENKIEIPATYKTVMQKSLVKKGGLQEWKEVLCQQDVTDNKVRAIQTALIREGYDPGTPDNQMGPKTKEALVKFQQDKGLPIGNLNFETLKALGVE